jgi:hypothetical protein
MSALVTRMEELQPELTTLHHTTTEQLDQATTDLDQHPRQLTTRHHAPAAPRQRRPDHVSFRRSEG